MILVACCCGCDKILWLNETEVDHYDTAIGGMIPPYQRPNETYSTEPCSPADGADYKLCGPWPLADRPAMGTDDADFTYILNNVFARQETSEDTATDYYFKNVQGRKLWHGARGFDEADDRYTLVNWDVDSIGYPIFETDTDASCPTFAHVSRPLVSAPPTNRYLTESRTLTYVASRSYDNGTNTIEETADYTRSAVARIDKDSGIITQDSYSETADLFQETDGVENPSPTMETMTTPWNQFSCVRSGGITITGYWYQVLWDALTASGGRLSGFDPCNIGPPIGAQQTGSIGGGGGVVFIPGGYTAAETQARMEYSDSSGGVTIDQTCTVTITNTTLIFEVEYTRTDTGVATDTQTCLLTFTKTLSNAYSATELRQDLEDLMALVDLTDDCKYPWRNGDCVVAPLVCRRERSGGLLTETFDGAFAASGYVDGGADYYDGEILGQLMPAGYRDIFAFDHLDYEWNIGASQWEVWRYGTACPDGYDIPRNSTEWTDKLQRQSIYPCNFLRYNDDEGLWGQKWVEKKLAFPSINFFRPCGADRDKLIADDPSPVLAWDDADVWPICGRIAVTDATNTSPIVITLAAAANYLRTGDSKDVSGVTGNTAANGTFIVTALTPTTFELNGSTGNGAYVSGGYVKTTGAPDHVWNDEATKGDWQTREWIYDYRLSGEYARLVAESIAIVANGCDALTLPTDPGGDLVSFTLTQKDRVATGTKLACTPNGETWGGGVVKDFPAEEDFVIDDKYGSLWLFQIVQAIPDPFYKQNVDAPEETPKYVEALNTVPVGAPTVHADVTIGCDVDTCGVPGLSDNPDDDPCEGLPYANPPGTGI